MRLSPSRSKPNGLQRVVERMFIVAKRRQRMCRRSRFRSRESDGSFRRSSAAMTTDTTGRSASAGRSFRLFTGSSSATNLEPSFANLARLRRGRLPAIQPRNRPWACFLFVESSSGIHRPCFDLLASSVLQLSYSRLVSPRRPTPRTFRRSTGAITLGCSPRRHSSSS